MKKWLIPLVYPFISILAFVLSGLLGLLVGGDLGGAAIVLIGLICYCLFAIPAICILYSKRCLPGHKYRVFFTVYQSFLLSLPFIVWFSFIVNGNEPGFSVFGPVAFMWCEVWSLIGLKLNNKIN